MDSKIRELITQNRLFEAINLMLAIKTNSKRKNSLALVQSRLNDLNERIRLGLISDENANLELNKIRKTLLDYCDYLEEVAENSAPKARLKRRLIIGLVLFASLLAISASLYMVFKPLKCEERKVAILVADFQNTENAEVDGFANSLVTRMDNALDDDVYEVTPVGPQSRKMKKYDDFIRAEHFKNTCDTSGLFVNGFLDLEDKVFNTYITIVGLVMKSPKFSNEKSLELDNPSGLGFSISDDSRFFADFLLAIIKSYEGYPFEALEKFLDLEKKDTNNIIKNDVNFKVAIAHFKGNCYALRGDSKRANEQYEVVSKFGNPEFKKIAQNNKSTAAEINKEMQEDPELKKDLEKNESEHKKMDDDFAKFLNKFRNVRNFRDFFK